MEPGKGTAGSPVKENTFELHLTEELPLWLGKTQHAAGPQGGDICHVQFATAVWRTSQTPYLMFRARLAPLYHLDTREVLKLRGSYNSHQGWFLKHWYSDGSRANRFKGFYLQRHFKQTKTQRWSPRYTRVTLLLPLAVCAACHLTNPRQCFTLASPLRTVDGLILFYMISEFPLTSEWTLYHQYLLNPFS